MGYRSDVGLVLSPEGYKKFQELENNKEIIEEFFDSADEHKEKNGAHYYQWESIKWYFTYEEIGALETFLDDLDSYDYKFVRLGEDDGDIEIMGMYCDNFYLGYKKYLYSEEDE